MARRVRCPGCGRDCTLTDPDRRGRVRCARCREVFDPDEAVRPPQPRHSVRADPKPVDPKPAEEKVVVIAPKDLGQALFDNDDGAFGRYINCVLQLQGVVKEQSKSQDGATITELVFLEPVTAKTTKEAKQYRI